FFRHYLKGYEGLHVAKKVSPCTKIGEECGLSMLPDGVAVFYKSKVFKRIFHRLFDDKSVTRISYIFKISFVFFFFFDIKLEERCKVVDVPAVLVHLQWVQSKSSGTNEFIVVGTHLKSAKDMEGEAHRLKQTHYLATEISSYQQKVEQDGRQVPVFIGVFLFYSLCVNSLNSNILHCLRKCVLTKDTKGFPPLTYASITDDGLFKNMLKEYKEKNSSAARVVIDLDNYQKAYDKLRFYSAYKGFYGSEPKYTTWKKRQGGEDKHTIDYLFFQHLKGVGVSSILEIPEEKAVNHDSLLPGWEYPSDHFAIMAEFEF
ncbi:hypothetical protein RFI_21562, partial [Reticulomyxa filosa]